jgi:S1-C subfamily serine protease
MMSFRKWVVSLVVLMTISTACSVSLRQTANGSVNDGSTAPAPVTSSVRISFPAQSPAGPTPTAIPADQRSLVDEEDQLMENIYQRANPSVVYIEVTEQQQTRRRGSVTVSASASGFIVDKQGHIVTNDHVVAQATDVKVTFADGTTTQATVLKEDSSHDLAVIKVDVPADSLTPVELGDSSALRPGQRVEAIGNPFGLVGTMTEGIVSAVGRALPTSMDPNGSLSKGDIIQTDAAINPGNSGGPLLDSNGRVIGVNTAMELNPSSGLSQPSGSGIGFAVPVNTVKTLIASYIGGR